MLARFRSNTARMLLILAILLIGGFLHYLWKTEAALNAPWTPDAGARLFAQRPLGAPSEKSLITTYKLPLRTRGRNIVDATGRRYKLSSVNWYGASDEHYIPGGLDVQHRDTIAQTIIAMGFNSVRMPYADEMVMLNPEIPDDRLAANPDLIGKRALDIFEAVVTSLTDAGIAVIINNHITSATWCCGADPCDAGWANDHLPAAVCRVRQTEEEWMEHWETIMGRFLEDPYVIGVDLRNEVRGLWGTMTWDRWATAAERCGNRLLKLNKNWLVVVGGTESGNDLTGVAKRPVRLDLDHRVVYSAHVYSWSGWGSREGRYAQRDYASFVAAMRRNWAYLIEGNLDPVWVGEFGAPHMPSVGDANYWQNLLRFLKSLDADFGYWAMNPRKPAGDTEETYALVEDDWLTPVLDYRMRDMSELMQLQLDEL
ncbi:glycoside hydrolase family 5 protein [Ophiostoma piceae UAMH 11346]|uniref:Glycoside hydrolase family 5 protein n=1 Tax=Ophiostoma piceae (strain UAMH 11346) TaxID=1262450 RepID=S3D4G8_OPHP1|nr:glycoside hydrolase family 5 protein [Ophiostoma piceae UAMH 11346]